MNSFYCDSARFAVYDVCPYEQTIFRMQDFFVRPLVRRTAQEISATVDAAFDTLFLVVARSVSIGGSALFTQPLRVPTFKRSALRRRKSFFLNSSVFLHTSRPRAHAT